MKRKDFIKKTLLGGIIGVATPTIIAAQATEKNTSTYDRLMEKVGFNHLPNKEQITMNTVLHKADTRGHANHGWLNSYHTFSFANYHNPARMHFGVLRVLNDDTVAASRGFGEHPHDNMEIISIPLEGDLQHKDSLGNIATIKEGEVQVMSAGTGVRHSEFNKNMDKAVKFLQIWVFPRARNIAPRYDQISIQALKKENAFYQILSPNKEDQGVWINQDAWFHLGNFEQGKKDTYTLHESTNGVYVFVLEGSVKVGDQQLDKRDGFGLWNTAAFTLEALTNDSRVLLMEVPMEV